MTDADKREFDERGLGSLFSKGGLGSGIGKAVVGGVGSGVGAGLIGALLGYVHHLLHLPLELTGFVC